MTRNVALSVQRDVNFQMEAIERLANILQEMIEQARKENNPEMLERAEEMATELAAISKKAYSVGTTVIDNAA